MAQNEAPPVSDFCVETEVPSDLPVIRLIGGFALEPQIDPTSGTPTSCGLTMDLVGNLQAALGVFQPFFQLLDTVATLAQCTLLATEVISNPFKIPDLLACIPGLVSKVNTLLQLVPVFPQGIQAFVTFVVDVVRFVATQIDCIVEILQSLQSQLDELARISEAINEVDDEDLAARMQELFDCGSEEVDRQLGLSLSVLGPIARVLCTVRVLLRSVPDGEEVQQLLQFPDPTSIVNLDDAITALQIIRTTLLTTEDVLIALTLGLGVLPPPEVGFVCPIDDEEPTLPAAPPPTPSISDVFEADGITPSSTVPHAPGGSGPDVVRVLAGSGFTSDSQVFWGTAQVDQDDVQFNSDTGRITVTIDPGLRSVEGTFQLSVVNEPEDDGGLFGGLALPGETADTGTEVSNLVPIDVV